MGSTVLNPNTTECLSLEIEIIKPKFPPKVHPGAAVMYPSGEQIHTLADEISQVAATEVSE